MHADLNNCASAKVRDRFTRDERGSFSIEFLLWMIVFLPLLAIIVDASLIYQAHADMWSVARDAARRMALSEMTPTQIQDYATAELATRSSFQFFVTAWESGTTAEPTAVVQIRLDVSNAGIFGWFATHYGGDMLSQVEMTRI